VCEGVGECAPEILSVAMSDHLRIFLACPRGFVYKELFLNLTCLGLYTSWLIVASE
jgi:hypothetical protein